MFVIFTILILQGRGAENIARAELENGDLRFGLEMVIAMGIVAIIESTTVSHDRHADVAKKGFSGYFLYFIRQNAPTKIIFRTFFILGVTNLKREHIGDIGRNLMTFLITNYYDVSQKLWCWNV